MTAILALFSALLYGVADFSGGFATRKNSVFAVMVITQAAGAVVALAAAPILGPNAPGLADLAWGLAAGVSGCMGVVALYRGLADCTAAVVSPLSALVGAMLPAAFGAIVGERLSGLALIGAALCLPAILLLSYEKGETRDREKLKASLFYGLVAGVGFGGFFIAISRSSPGSGLWPLVGARAASFAIVSAIVLFGRKGFSVEPSHRPAALFAGAADMAANICFLLASRTGLLILATLVTSLYPTPTVILARLFLGQRISVPRAAGIGLAIASVALIGLR